LRHELDWIVMKALEKDRTRRYDTANGLASDIQRYLADEVVEARPPRVGYRVSKVVRRHQIAPLVPGPGVLSVASRRPARSGPRIQENPCQVSRPDFARTPEKRR
jgi:hypothetical protein